MDGRWIKGRGAAAEEEEDKEEECAEGEGLSSPPVSRQSPDDHLVSEPEA